MLCMRRGSSSEWDSQWSDDWEAGKAELNARTGPKVLWLSWLQNARIKLICHYRTTDAFLHSGSWIINAIIVHCKNRFFCCVSFFFFLFFVFLFLLVLSVLWVFCLVGFVFLLFWGLDFFIQHSREEETWFRWNIWNPGTSL